MTSRDPSSDAEHRLFRFVSIRFFFPYSLIFGYCILMSAILPTFVICDVLMTHQKHMLWVFVRIKYVPTAYFMENLRYLRLEHAHFKLSYRLPYEYGDVQVMIKTLLCNLFPDFKIRNSDECYRMSPRNVSLRHSDDGSTQAV